MSIREYPLTLPVSIREYPLTHGVVSLRAHFHPPGLASSPTGSAVVFDEYLRVLTVLTVPPEAVRCHTARF